MPKTARELVDMLLNAPVHIEENPVKGYRRLVFYIPKDEKQVTAPDDFKKALDDVVNTKVV